MAKTGKTGVTTNTPKNIVFGAGTIHKGLKYTASYNLTADNEIDRSKTYYTRTGKEGSYIYTAVVTPNVQDIATYYEKSGAWNFDNSIIGATNGGSKLTITPEITKVEADGAFVAVKGLTVKTGEAATIEINFIELTKEIIKAATIGKDGESEDASNYDLIESKANIEEGDYFENIAFVGQTLEGKNIIVILENAICTSGLELAGENKSGTVATVTFESHAELSSDLDTLPYKIYYPKATA